MAASLLHVRTVFGIGRRRGPRFYLILACLAAAAIAPAWCLAAESKDAAAGKPAADPRQESKIVALVNGTDVTRDELSQECLRHYGKAVLESLVNRHLIVEECKRQNVSVTKAEVNAEIERLAGKFNLPVEQWLKMLKQERGIKPAQYSDEIIWPTLALRKLAGGRLRVSDEELTTEFEMQYGPAVRARMIVAATMPDAQKLREAAVAKPEEFGILAKNYSRDVNSASSKGLIQPIRKHSGHEQVEQAVFNIKDGEISQVVQIGEQFAFFRRESLIPAAEVDFNKVKPGLEELLKERKMHGLATDIFRELQKAARVENVMNDPAKRQQMPGVAALINGHPITLANLGEACIQRHGEEVLEGMINRRLLEQAAKKAKLTITDKDLDEEIARAAGNMVRSKPDGSPDVAAWLKVVTGQRGLTLENYRNDEVWPSVVLRKLVAGKVKVSDEELQKGFEANYGPRVRCRAIVLNNPRQAQKVWELARENPSPENFGRLAEQYSIEASSRALQGEVPPIKKNGGQPLLEREAFALKPGELSSIIQAGDTFVILLCEGFTEPIKVEFASVRDLIHEDIFEKKMNLAMAECFEQIQAGARVDNFLAGTSRSPRKADDGKALPGVPQLRQIPGKG